MPDLGLRHGAVYVKTLAEHLIAQGYSPEQVFADTSFGPEVLAEERPFGEFPDIASFFERAARLTQNDVLGFQRGMERDMRRVGLLCYVGLASPTVRDFIRNAGRYRRVFSDVIEFDENATDRDNSLNWYFRVPAKVERRQIVEFGASGLLAGLEHATQRKLHLRKVQFRHLRKTNLDVFREYLGCPVEFGAPVNSLEFAAGGMDMPLATADHELYSVLTQYAEDVLSRHKRNTSALVVDVERAIAKRLAAGEANQETVARALGFSARTLARRLAQEGTTFFSTLRDLRENLACSYLRNSDLGLGEIAYLLGYSNLSSFADAFKRWVGVSPGRFRTNAAQGL